MFSTYILHSQEKDKYYIGYTADLEERIRKHNTNHKGFTGNTNGWRLVWSEVHGNEVDAQKRENQIKGWKSRKMIEKLIGV